MRLRFDFSSRCMPSVIAIFAIFLGLLTLLPGCERSSAPLPVRIGYGTQPGALLLMLAREQAYFEQEGLTPTYMTYPSGKRALNEGLFADQSDITSASDLPVVDSLKTGKDLVVLASLQAARSINSIVARRDRGIEGISDLTGKRVGTQQTSAVHFFLDRALQANGVNPSRVSHVFYPAEQLVPALVDGKIDAMSMREPFVSEALAKLGENGIVLEAPWVYPQFEVLVVRRAYADAHGEEMRRVLRALLRAERYLNEQPREAAVILARVMQLPMDSTERLLAQTINRVGLSQALLSMMDMQKTWLDNPLQVFARTNGGLLDAFYPAPLQTMDALRVNVPGFNQHEMP